MPCCISLTFALCMLGAVIGGINQRRGTIMDSEVREDEFTCVAEVALNDMFGYSNHLRGITQGKGTSLFFNAQSRQGTDRFASASQASSAWSTRPTSRSCRRSRPSSRRRTRRRSASPKSKRSNPLLHACTSVLIDDLHTLRAYAPICPHYPRSALAYILRSRTTLRISYNHA